jgi:hypothetical protein
VGDDLRHPYQFPDMTNDDSPNMMGFLFVIGFFTMPALLPV